MAEHRMVGDILSERRHSLGLSIERVAQDTKLQPRMVEAFEDTDFDAMPPKGYAQASLASYARYLGLNPNEILRVYDDQLYEYEREASLAARPSARGRSGARPEEERPAAGRQGRGRYAPEGDEPVRARRGGRAGGYEEAGARRRSGSSYSDTPYDRPVPANARDWRDRGEREERAYDDAPSGGLRSRGRGLYDNGSTARRPASRAGGLYDTAPAPRRAPEDRPAPRDRYDRGPVGRGRYDREPAGSTGRGRPIPDARDERDTRGARDARAGRDRGRQGARRETEVVTLDDGYQGGSGGSGGYDERYQPRPDRRASAAADRQSVSEVLLGFWNTLRADARTFAIVVGAVVLTLAVVLAVGISSCVRGGSGTDGGPAGNIPVTPVGGDAGAQQTGGTAPDASQQQPVSTEPLAPSIDLNALPANAVITVQVAAEAVSPPWIEAWVDDAGVLAENSVAGASYQWTVTRTATLKFSNIDGVSVAVNGVPVTPTPDNGAFALFANVAPDQQPQPDAGQGDAAADDGSGEGGDGSSGGYYDEAGNWVEG